jgi:cysteine desulfurase/selenocysteine lyase
MSDLSHLRADFPALEQLVHGKPLVYLDSAATALKPRAVIDAIDHVYEHDTANIHRAVHLLSQRATAAYEGVRPKVASFLHAADPEEIVFVRGTTEAMNLVANAWGRKNLRAGDEIVMTELEHHSTIVPWQMIAAATGAKLVVVPVEDDGSVELAQFEKRIGERTRIVVTAHVSNALGTIQDARAIAALAHRAGALAFFDGAQSAPHVAVDVRAIDADFYAFSGHKLYGPTGAGVLYGKKALLEAMDPWQGGGDMIREVRFSGTTYNTVPHKFEAGTPDIASVIGLGAAIDYVAKVGLDRIEEHERALLAHGARVLSAIPGLRLVGTAKSKVAVFSFVADWAHPTDIGTLVDLDGVAIRTGHHCTQPLHERFGLSATARASCGLYNTEADLDVLGRAVDKARWMFTRRSQARV